MDPEFLYFGHFEAEKIEFEVGRSNFEKWQFSNFFWLDILMLRHPVHFKSFLLWSDDIIGTKPRQQELATCWLDGSLIHQMSSQYQILVKGSLQKKKKL